MISFLVFALLVVLACIIIIYVAELLIGLLPGPPAHIATIVRAVIILIALLVILERALPLLGQPRLL